MTVTHNNTFYKGRLVIEGTEDEFQVLNTWINEVIDKLINDSLADLCDVGALKMAYSIRNNLSMLIDDLVTYRLDDGFHKFLKWEEEYQG